LRRAEAWEDADATAAALAKSNPPEAVAQVLALERRLIGAGDAGRHTVASALPPPSRRPHVTHQRVAPRGQPFLARLRRWFRGR
jgi:hypothetical protein